MTAAGGRQILLNFSEQTVKKTTDNSSEARMPENPGLAHRGHLDRGHEGVGGGLCAGSAQRVEVLERELPLFAQDLEGSTFTYFMWIKIVIL